MVIAPGTLSPSALRCGASRYGPAMARRDTARYMAALALAGSLAPSLMRRARREQVAVSAGAAVLGGAAGWATESAVAQLARRLRGGEATARLSIAGIGAGCAVLGLDAAGAGGGAARGGGGGG